MRLFRRNEFMIEDLENRIIEMDDFEPEIKEHSYDDDDIFHSEEIIIKDYKKIHDTVINGIYIMTISGLCCCFACLSLLYPLF